MGVFVLYIYLSYIIYIHIHIIIMRTLVLVSAAILIMGCGSHVGPVEGGVADSSFVDTVVTDSVLVPSIDTLTTVADSTDSI